MRTTVESRTRGRRGLGRPKFPIFAGGCTDKTDRRGRARAFVSFVSALPGEYPEFYDAGGGQFPSRTPWYRIGSPGNAGFRPIRYDTADAQQRNRSSIPDTHAAIPIQAGAQPHLSSTDSLNAGEDPPKCVAELALGQLPVSAGEGRIGLPLPSVGCPPRCIGSPKGRRGYPVPTGRFARLKISQGCTHVLFLWKQGAAVPACVPHRWPPFSVKVRICARTNAERAGHAEMMRCRSGSIVGPPWSNLWSADSERPCFPEEF